MAMPQSAFMVHRPGFIVLRRYDHLGTDETLFVTALPNGNISILWRNEKGIQKETEIEPKVLFEGIVKTMLMEMVLDAKAAAR